MIQYVKIGRYNNKEGVFNNQVHCLTVASVMHFVQKRRDWRTSGRGHYVAGEVRNRDEFFLLLKSIPFLMKITYFLYKQYLLSVTETWIKIIKIRIKNNLTIDRRWSSNAVKVIGSFEIFDAIR